MKAFFIFRDGELFGNPIGYTTEKNAKKSLVGCEDWYRLLREYDLGNATFTKECPPPSDLVQCGMREYGEYCETYLFKREVWSRKIWTPYAKEHYKIIEKEFDIIFKD